MEVAEHIDALDEQGELLARSAEGTDLDRQVPTCPEWQLRDLLAHIGRVHRWAATYVATGRTTMLSDDEEKPIFGDPPPDARIRSSGSGPVTAICATRFAPHPQISNAGRSCLRRRRSHSGRGARPMRRQSTAWTQSRSRAPSRRRPSSLPPTVSTSCWWGSPPGAASC